MTAPLRIRAAAAPSPASPAAPPTVSAPDDYLGRLIKLIPAEVMALYLSFKSTFSDSQLEIWGTICLGLVIFVRAAATYQSGKPQLLAVVVAAVSFVLWIYGIDQKLWAGNYILGWLEGPFSSAMIAVWTFVVPYFYKGD